MWCSSKPCIFAGFNYQDHHQQQGVPLNRLHQPTSFIIDDDHPSFDPLNRKQGRSSPTSLKVKCDEGIHPVRTFSDMGKMVNQREDKTQGEEAVEQGQATPEEKL